MMKTLTTLVTIQKVTKSVGKAQNATAARAMLSKPLLAMLAWGLLKSAGVCAVQGLRRSRSSGCGGLLDAGQLLVEMQGMAAEHGRAGSAIE